jgi:3-isopropylmalate/(R)-2-methylmalate dehydratase large subunit
MGMTIAEKVITRAAGLQSVRPGQYVDCRIDRVIAHEEFYRVHTAAVESQLPNGLPDIWDRERLHVICEHFQPALNPTQASGRARSARSWRPTRSATLTTR